MIYDHVNAGSGAVFVAVCHGKVSVTNSLPACHRKLFIPYLVPSIV